jgi:hypothetical protein
MKKIHSPIKVIAKNISKISSPEFAEKVLKEIKEKTGKEIDFGKSERYVLEELSNAIKTLNKYRYLEDQIAKEIYYRMGKDGEKLDSLQKKEPLRIGAFSKVSEKQKREAFGTLKNKIVKQVKGEARRVFGGMMPTEEEVFQVVKLSYPFRNAIAKMKYADAQRLGIEVSRALRKELLDDREFLRMVSLSKSPLAAKKQFKELEFIEFRKKLESKVADRFDKKFRFKMPPLNEKDYIAKVKQTLVFREATKMLDPSQKERAAKEIAHNLMRQDEIRRKLREKRF